MSANENTPLCKKCGTPMVPANQALKMDGSVKMDGTCTFNGMVCPKCHPELASKK